MKIKDILSITFAAISKYSKNKLLRTIQLLREKCIQLSEQNSKLEAENKKLKEKLKKQKIQSVNKDANKPSSKRPEWDKKGFGNDGKEKKRKGRGKKPRKGAGNRPKNLKPDRTEKEAVDRCSLCGKDLADEKPLPTINVRIIEDIPEPVERPEVIKVEQEKKYCPDCKAVITAKSELALPKANIGLNSTILICYLWVALCLPFTRIKDYLKVFFGKDISTSGLSKHVIRVSGIMKDVYDEILGDINNAITLHADETGWRVRGKNWWLWVFGTQDSAFFTVDQSRGSDVVRRVLGEIFLGLLVVDGWYAYLKIICEQQSCMAHLMRKIRKFRDAFPHLSSIVKFYVKLRRILRDGERLQSNRKKLGEKVFQRRLKRLKMRLEKLVNWPDPDDILQEIIKKVKKQQPRMLTFVEHPDAPCHNNYGEFLIRIGVLKRKVSGGSVSAEGAHAYAILLSIYVTCKLRSISFPKYMKESLRHYIRTGKPMLLRTYSTFIAENHEQKMAA